MKFFWSIILCVTFLHVAFAGDVFSYKDFIPQPPKPAGIFDMITKPKVPKIPLLPTITVEKHIGPGSFGFGIGIGIGGGVSSVPGGVDLPHDEKPHTEKPHTSWDEKEEDVAPRPNWGDETDDAKTKPDIHKEDKDTAPESYEENNKGDEADWEDIGENSKDNRSEDMMDGDLVGGGLIQPRLKKNRPQRSVDSKIYHLKFPKFISDAQPYGVKFFKSLSKNSLSKRNHIE